MKSRNQRRKQNGESRTKWDVQQIERVKVSTEANDFAARLDVAAKVLYELFCQLQKSSNPFIKNLEPAKAEVADENKAA